MIGVVPLRSAAEIGEIVVCGQRGAQISAQLPRHARAKILRSAADRVEAKTEAFADLIVAEAGKPINAARREVGRCVHTLRLSAAEALRSPGEVLAFDGFSGGEARQGWFTREPLGLIAAITPYNDPLNLVAHKLGPAIAAGNGVLLKPSELAPISALRLVKALQAAGLPPEVVTVCIGGADLGEALVRAEPVRMVSFTGGPKTAMKIAEAAGLKRLAMDLGGNAPVLVLADADLDLAAQACVDAAFGAAGQNCIGAQRILVAAEVFDLFERKVCALTEQLRCGDPRDERTDIGPMISETAAKRVERLVDDAIRSGGVLRTGHRRSGSLYLPTVVTRPCRTSALWRDEAFGPVVVLEPFEDLEAAIAAANDTEFTLHAGVFTRQLDLALEVADRLEASGVMINDSSDVRLDAAPFGGFKGGSLGREGVRFAYEEMTHTKTVCIRRAARPPAGAPGSAPS